MGDDFRQYSGPPFILEIGTDFTNILICCMQCANKKTCGVCHKIPGCHGKSQNALLHAAASYLQGYRLLPISKAGN